MGVASGREPVLEQQVGDILEVRCVVGHQRQLMREGDGGDEKVHGADRDPDPLELDSQLSELFGARFIEREGLDVVLEEGRDGREEFAGIGAKILPRQ
jgi:hypothetical protein